MPKYKEEIHKMHKKIIVMKFHKWKKNVLLHSLTILNYLVHLEGRLSKKNFVNVTDSDKAFNICELFIEPFIRSLLFQYASIYCLLNNFFLPLHLCSIFSFRIPSFPVLFHWVFLIRSLRCYKNNLCGYYSL